MKVIEDEYRIAIKSKNNKVNPEIKADFSPSGGSAVFTVTVVTILY